jgi:hypothetical protein
MGWCSGSQLAEDIWSEISEELPDDQILRLAKIVYDKFCDHDADDWDCEIGGLWSMGVSREEFMEYLKDCYEDDPEKLAMMVEEYNLMMEALA